MHVHWLGALVRVEAEPPTLDIENGGHGLQSHLGEFRNFGETAPLALAVNPANRSRAGFRPSGRCAALRRLEN